MLQLSGEGHESPRSTPTQKHSTSLVILVSKAVQYVDCTSGERHEFLNKSPVYDTKLFDREAPDLDCPSGEGHESLNMSPGYDT